MAEQPQTWHYGLVARWWAEFNRAEPDELDFYQGFVAADGQPALDLACGTGRILLPLLRAGLDVDGAEEIVVNGGHSVEGMAHQFMPFLAAVVE